jgi:hypothetical protein
MRRLTVVLSFALALGVFFTGTTALASGGLPKLADLQAGPYDIALHNDSPSLVVGRNVLTLEVPSEAASKDVRLSLVSANGETVAVSLRTVTVIGGSETAGSMEGMAGMETAGPVLLRGTADLPRTGPWQARVSVTDPSGDTQSAEQELSAIDGGPNRLYLYLVGTVIATALLGGAIGRRRAAPARAGRTR